MGTENRAPGAGPEGRQNKSIQLEASPEKGNEMFMGHIFEIEERFDSVLGGIISSSSAEDSNAHSTHELREIKEELVLLLLAKSNISMKEWRSYVDARIERGG